MPSPDPPPITSAAGRAPPKNGEALLDDALCVAVPSPASLPVGVTIDVSVPLDPAVAVTLAPDVSSVPDPPSVSVPYNVSVAPLSVVTAVGTTVTLAVATVVLPPPTTPLVSIVATELVNCGGTIVPSVVDSGPVTVVVTTPLPVAYGFEMLPQTSSTQPLSPPGPIVPLSPGMEPLRPGSEPLRPGTPPLSPGPLLAPTKGSVREMLPGPLLVSGRVPARVMVGVAETSVLIRDQLNDCERDGRELG
ncbi:MAG: hypothetical protein M1822_007884 [Bathelium mastoideum]|nr:MAG: hypothetical protein M1822_007884 [Bathelium mastoideum]